MVAFRHFFVSWWWLSHARRCIFVLLVGLLSLACGGEARPAKTPNECNEVVYLEGARGYPFRLPSKSGIFADEYQPLPSSGEWRWWIDAQQNLEKRAQKYLIAQPVPVRSPLLGGGRPQCAPNPAWATAVRDERDAMKLGEVMGQQYGEVFGTIEEEIDFLANGWAHDGQLLKRILSHPEEREALFRAFAQELDAVPELPTFTDEALARKAQAGFEKGYKAGIDSAHRRAFLINASVDVYFMVIGNVAGALESAGAKILDKAILRIRSMPIFVPGTVGGGGFFMKAPPRPPAGSSRKLLKALLEAGKKPLDGEVPHHTVAHSDIRAERAREILRDFDMKLDEAPNGVFLPGTPKAPNPMNKAVHSKVHTNEYYKVLTERLGDAKSKEEAIKILEGIAKQLEHGGLK